MAAFGTHASFLACKDALLRLKPDAVPVEHVRSRTRSVTARPLLLPIRARPEPDAGSRATTAWDAGRMTICEVQHLVIGNLDAVPAAAHIVVLYLPRLGAHGAFDDVRVSRATPRLSLGATPCSHPDLVTLKRRRVVAEAGFRRLPRDRTVPVRSHGPRVSVRRGGKRDAGYLRDRPLRQSAADGFLRQSWSSVNTSPLSKSRTGWVHV